MLLAVSFIRVRVEGVEKLDPRGAYVFVANHGSFMDIPALLASLPQQFRFFAKKSLFRIPFLGTHLERAGHIPVDRSNARASLKSMMEAARIIRERGVSVLNFPEGGRSAEGLREFKEGPAYIAIKAGRACSAGGHRGHAGTAADGRFSSTQRQCGAARGRPDSYERDAVVRPHGVDAAAVS